MATSIVFLRGVNVGGHNRMKMDALWAKTARYATMVGAITEFDPR